MATSVESKRAEEIQAEYVIDADFHLDPPVEKILPYVVDGPVRDRLAEHGYPKSGSNREGSQTAAHYESPEPLAGLRTQGRAIDGESVRAAADSVGIDLPIVSFGISNRIGSAMFPSVKTAIVRAFNDYVLDEVADVDDVKALIVLPQWDPDSAVAELDRLGAESDMVGAYAWIGPYEMWGMPQYDPVFERLERHGLPLVLHHSGDGQRFDPIGRSVRTWVEAIWVMPCTKAIQNTANMILTGVFDEFPDLDVVYHEAGANWLPFLAWRLDETYQDHPEDLKVGERMLGAGRKYLERKPSDYVFDNFYCGTQPICKPGNPDEFEKLLDVVHAADTFIYSSDWPHHTFDPPWWVSSVLPEAVREPVMHGNARDVFRL
jgi:predicted TIM-barrel fold metal-dependent hydrolase